MNLSDHFEPMDVPATGLGAVRRTARRRAVVQRLSSGGASLALLIVFVGGSYLSTSWFFGTGAAVRDDQSGVTSKASVNENPSTGDGATPGFANLTPDGAGLPGGSVALNVTGGLLFYGLILGIGTILIVTIVRVASVATTDEPQLGSNTWTKRLLIAVVALTLFIVLVVPGLY